MRSPDIRSRNTILPFIALTLLAARPGFEAWFGVRPEVTPGLRDFVLSQ